MWYTQSGQPDTRPHRRRTIAIDYTQLARAAADNDFAAERLGDTPSVLRDLRLDSDGIDQIAEQRALRIILIQRGESEEVRRLAHAGEFKTFQLSDAEEMRLLLLQLAWMDGAAAVAKAMQSHPDAWQE